MHFSPSKQANPEGSAAHSRQTDSVSSEASAQSTSPSHSHDLLMHLSPFKQGNSSGEQERVGEGLSASAVVSLLLVVWTKFKWVQHSKISCTESLNIIFTLHVYNLSGQNLLVKWWRVGKKGVSHADRGEKSRYYSSQCLSSRSTGWWSTFLDEILFYSDQIRSNYHDVNIFEYCQLRTT